jgi:hypothetical protein
MTNGVRWSVFTLVASVVSSSCSQSSTPASPVAGLSVNNAVLAALEAKGIAPDVAAFFAATKIDAKCPNDTTCVYLQTFPNGATREITLKVFPDRPYTPAPDEIAKAAPGRAPVYGFKYASAFQADPVKIDLDFYVAKEGLPTPVAKAQMFPDMRLMSSAQSGGGAGISWGEVGKKGGDAVIGAMIDAAKDRGVRVGPLGSAYALASALSDVSTAADIGKQNTAWLKELDALETCAANPTNQVAKSDVTYSRTTVAKIQEARRELKEVNSVRFLNVMTEKFADITPVTAVLAVGLKQGFVWSEQTLGDYSENTIMREARLAVVKCGDPGNPSGNLKFDSECTVSATDHTVTHFVGNVTWVWQAGVKYVPTGDYTYSVLRTAGTCTEKSSAAGRLEGTGWLFVFDDPERQKELGYGYEARFNNIPATVAFERSCGVSATLKSDIDWLPVMHGFQGAGGKIEGVAPGNGCRAGQPATLKWSFSIPPK